MYRGGVWLDSLLALLVLFGTYEIGQMARRHGVAFSPLMMGALALFAVLLSWRLGGRYWPLWVILLVLTPVMPSLRRRAPGDAVAVWAIQAGGALWMGVGFGALAALRLEGPQEGFWWLVFLFANLWLGDTAAYLFGKWLGKRPLAIELSPRKTVAGSVAQVVTSGAVALVFILTKWLQAPPVLLIVAALVIGVVGQIGDLFESALKRTAGCKDSSAIIPGHGGVLDRFDSTLFAAPALWALVQLWP
jgi:phosphatidate cytidylyltransferase